MTFDSGELVVETTHNDNDNDDDDDDDDHHHHHQMRKWSEWNAEQKWRVRIRNHKCQNMILWLLSL